MRKILDKYFEQTQGFYPFFKYCPKKFQTYYINKRASKTLGYEYNYLEPKTFNEKIRWLIYNEKLNIKSYLTDKIKVKTYINEMLGEGICTPIYGIWNNFDDIEFSYLPARFVLKANHAWNTNLIISNKEQIKNNRKYIKKITTSWLKMHYEEYSLEPQYKHIKPRLFAEKYLPEAHFKQDFQIHCFNGEPYMTEVVHEDRTSSFYDNDWTILPYTIYKQSKPVDNTKKPVFFEKMLEYSKKLAERFSYVRIDFAGLKDRPVIFEMSFTPFSAMMPFSNKIFDLELGNLIKI